MKGKWLWITLATLGVAAVAAFMFAVDSSDVPPRETLAPATSRSPAEPALPFEGPTPIELRFCSADEAIFVLESRVAYEEIPLPRAQDHLRTLEGITAELARWTKRRGETELSQRVASWSRAFRQARVRITEGADPLDALRPALRRRNQIENIFTCELDA